MKTGNFNIRRSRRRKKSNSDFELEKNSDSVRLEKEKQMHKEVAYYSSILTGWYGTAFEHDKSILTLSSAGIALLITLLTTVGAKSSLAVLFVFFSMVAFLISVVAVLTVFRLNKEHLIEVAKGNDHPHTLLVFCDKVVISSFFVGVLCAALVGLISIPINLDSKDGDNMKNEKKSLPTVVEVNDANSTPKVDVRISIAGIGALKPSGSAQGDKQKIVPPSSETKVKAK